VERGARHQFHTTSTNQQRKNKFNLIEFQQHREILPREKEGKAALFLLLKRALVLRFLFISARAK